MKVLIIEDDESTLALLRQYFRTQGYQPDCHENAEDGYTAFQRTAYSLVITDWNLPGMDGPSFCRKIRSHGRGPGTHIIMISAEEGDTQMREAIAAGADDYLTKPVDFQLLGVRLLIAEQRFLNLNRGNLIKDELKYREVEETRLDDGAWHERGERLAGLQMKLQSETAARPGMDEQLERALEYHRDLVRNLPGSIFLFDRDLNYRIANVRDPESLLPGVDESEAGIAGRRFRETRPANLCDLLAPYYRAALFGSGGEFEWRARERVFRVQIIPLTTDHNEVYGGLEIMRDVTTDAKRLEALRESRERFELVHRAGKDGLWDWDQTSGRVYYSARWREIIGLETPEPETSETWLQRVHEEDREKLESDLQTHLRGKSDVLRNEHRLRHENGKYIWVLCRGLASRDEEGNALRLAGSLTDITDTKMDAARLEGNTLYDRLTGLPNRALFTDRLTRTVERTRNKPDALWAVVSVDLIRFKSINDTFGYETGDLLLKMVALSMEKQLRRGDTLARLSGDEFALILENLNDQAEAEAVARNISDALSTQYRIERRDIHLSAAIGIAFNTEGFEKPEELLRDAEIAMNHAREWKEGGYEIFHGEMGMQSRVKVNMEASLRTALQRMDFELRYQPIVDAKEETLKGVEVLIRWFHPELGEISPVQFIPIAEETGMITSIGEWVLRTACAQNRAWQRAGYAPLYISVNLSPRQFLDPNLLELTRKALEDSGMDPEYLTFEITEGSSMKDVDYTSDVLTRFAELGIRISLDDFGTGHSSLAYLKQLPFHNLKIDRSFVRDIPRDAESTEITRAIITMARGLKLRIIAEGVEEQEQLDFLREQECDMIQGYYFGKPMRAAEIARMMQNGARK